MKISGLMSPALKRRLSLILLAYMVAGGTLYLNALDNSFHYDDRYYIVDYRDISHLEWFPSANMGLGQKESDIAHRSHYRPIVYASYTMNHAIGGLDPVGYHVVNLLIHVLTAFLVALVLDQLTGRLAMGALAGFLFLIHPFNTEAVNYITARSSQLYTMFYLLAFYAYTRYRPPFFLETGGTTIEVRMRSTVSHPYLWLVVTFLSFVLSMLSKEMAVTLPITLVLYELLMGPSARWQDRLRYIGVPLGITTTVVVSYLGIRKILVGGALQSGMGHDLVRQLSTQGVVLVRTLGLILWPAGLTIDHRVEVYETFATWPVAGACIVWVGFLGIIWWWGRSNLLRKRVLAFLLVWFFVALSPLMVLRLNAMLQENRAYLAVVGIVGLMAIGLFGVLDWVRIRKPNLKWGIYTGAVILVLVYGGLTIRRNAVWQDDFSLWSDTVRKNPVSSEAHLALGTAYHQQKNLDLAVKEYELALRLKPDEYRARGNLAQVYRQQGRYDLSVTEYQRVIQIVPRDPEAHYGLGLTFQMVGQMDFAIKEYQTVLALNPRHEKALLRLNSLYATHDKSSQ